MIKGGCYCGAVTYEIHGKLLMFANCHCPDCRKFTGAAFSSVLATETDGFRITSGEKNLVAYESSPGKLRHFCGTCGCHIHLRAAHRPNMIFIRAGTLDDDPGIQPQGHFWTSMKAPWYNISDNLPQHEQGLPRKSNDSN